MHHVKWGRASGGFLARGVSHCYEEIISQGAHWADIGVQNNHRAVHCPLLLTYSMHVIYSPGAIPTG